MTTQPQRKSDLSVITTGPGLSVHCQELSCSYRSERGSVPALDRITLSLRPQEFVSLVGPSGCGKSTLIRAIAGLMNPTSGRILYGDVPGGAGTPRGGLVVQENGTFPWMTVVDNVAFGLEMQGVGRAERCDRALAYLERVGLANHAHNYPHELSVGMRQRVGIGRAFVAESPILLMDEPFGALDAQTRWVLQTELLRVWSESRRLVLFVTHDIHEAVLLADRVVVMSGHPGRIREEIPVAIGRPRDPRDVSRKAQELISHIWHLLGEEVASGLTDR
jgi:NitT/TauT family transport system ATP-binding protein